MLPKTHRFPLHFSGKNQLQGRKIHSPHLTIIYALNPHKHLRLGVIISKKISVLAVDRNRLKRQLHQTIRKYLKLSTPIDILIIPKPSITQLTYPQLEVVIKEIVSKFHPYKPT